MDFNAFIEELKNFDSEDFQNIGQAPIIIRVSLWLAAFLAAGIAALIFLSEPKYSEIQKLQANEVKLKEQFIKESRQAANKEKYEKQLRDIQESFGVLLKKLPQQIEIDQLIENIDAAAKEHNVTIDKQNLGTILSKEFYYEFPIALSFSGSYHDIGQFFGRLSGLTQIITLHDVTLSRKSQRAGVSSISGEVTVKTYSYVPDESGE